MIEIDRFENEISDYENSSVFSKDNARYLRIKNELKRVMFNYAELYAKLFGGL